MILMANVDLPEEIELAVRHGAQGVGLVRTEFLVTGRTSLPSENEQAEYFRRVASAFPGQPVIIRTFDLGGDKFPAAFDAPVGGQSVPGLALDPGLPRPARHVPAPVARAASRGGATGRFSSCFRWSPGWTR